jgi:cytoskeleton protein RodZ
LQSTQDARPVAAAETQPEAEKDRTPKPGERQVRLAFDQESWVEIRDRNERIIFSQLNRPGTQQFVNGVPPFSIVVGNAQGVRMTYAEKPVDLAPHTRTDVARLILQ